MTVTDVVYSLLRTMMTTKSAFKRKKMSTEVDVDWHVEKKCNADRARYMFETSFYCDCDFRQRGP